MATKKTKTKTKKNLLTMPQPVPAPQPGAASSSTPDTNADALLSLADIIETYRAKGWQVAGLLLYQRQGRSRSAYSICWYSEINKQIRARILRGVALVQASGQSIVEEHDEQLEEV